MVNYALPFQILYQKLNHPTIDQKRKVYVQQIHQSGLRLFILHLVLIVEAINREISDHDVQKMADNLEKAFIKPWENMPFDSALDTDMIDPRTTQGYHVSTTIYWAS